VNCLLQREAARLTRGILAYNFLPSTFSATSVGERNSFPRYRQPLSPASAALRKLPFSCVWQFSQPKFFPSSPSSSPPPPPNARWRATLDGLSPSRPRSSRASRFLRSLDVFLRLPTSSSRRASFTRDTTRPSILATTPVCREEEEGSDLAFKAV